MGGDSPEPSFSGRGWPVSVLAGGMPWGPQHCPPTALHAGMTHQFRRPGGHWFTCGTHYVGQMGPKDPMREFMDFVTGGVEWDPLPNEFDVFCFGSDGGKFAQPTGTKAWTDRLLSWFPDQRKVRGWPVEVCARAERGHARSWACRLGSTPASLSHSPAQAHIRPSPRPHNTRIRPSCVISRTSARCTPGTRGTF